MVAIRHTLPGVETTSYDFRSTFGDECVARFRYQPPGPGDALGDGPAVFRVVDGPPPPPFPEWDMAASNDLMQMLRIAPPGGR